MGSAKGLLTHKWLTHMLTDTKLRTLKPRESAYRVADTNSLCIEVRPSGARWVLECLDTVSGGRGVALVAAPLRPAHPPPATRPKAASSGQAQALGVVRQLG